VEPSRKNENPVGFLFYAVLLSLTWGWLGWVMGKLANSGLAKNRQFDPASPAKGTGQ
jgi:hypothetical protein